LRPGSGAHLARWPVHRHTPVNIRTRCSSTGSVRTAIASRSCGDLARLPDPFAPARLGPVELRNRVIKAATFEGLTRKHVVSDRLIEFHRSMARGGVGMTTVAFCAVSEEGCGTPNEIVMTADVASGFRTLADAVHAEGAAVSVQLGHAGAVAAATG